MHEDDNIYQEEIDVYQNFMVFNGTCLIELDICDIKLFFLGHTNGALVLSCYALIS
jgi:hypothetical protein